jgi:hypothetical protein
MGGFECSSHRRADGSRLDLLAATRHDSLAEADYALLQENGISTARDGLRWHLIEQQSGIFDWASARLQTAAARKTGIQIIWDLCHYGIPDHIDVWSDAFPARFAAFATAAAGFLRAEGCGALLCPINEISFWAWAGGDAGKMNPNATNRGGALKQQLVRASLAAMKSIRAADPAARFVFAEPLIHVDGGSGSAGHRRNAENYRLSQFETLDMITGRLQPELGGSQDLLDVVGVNFYPDNQWYLGGSTIPLGHHAYRPLRTMLAEVYQRYGKPIILSETGAEGGARPAWLHYVVQEVLAAMEAGIPIRGICLYPILDCIGWEGNRVCPVGLFSEVDDQGVRAIDRAYQQELFLRQACVRAIAPASDLARRPVMEPQA